MEGPRLIFQNALLAQAAYGNFDIDNGSTVYPDNSVKDRIKVEGDADYTNAQAENFAGPQGYTLRSFTSDPSTGFEAALFESRVEPGKYTLAIRGTAGLTDIVGADIFGLIAQGQASAQSVSLYRYYKRLITARGVEVAYSQAEIDMLAAVTNRKYDGYGLAFLRNSSEFRTVATGLAQQLKGDVGLGRLDPSAMIDVTGHSLGGHLAQVFGALFFPDRVGHIYTYNGAGLGGSVYKVAKKFLNDRSSDLSAKSTNIVAEEGLTLAAGFGYKFGQNQRLAIEAGILTDNHSITNSTDSLALYALLGQVSPNLSLDDFNKIVRGATNDAKNGYEATLDILRRIFLGPGIQSTQRGFLNDLAARDELYRNIDELKANADFTNFVGANGRPYSVATLVGAVNCAGLAADDTDGISYRYALKQLNPFAVVGASYAQHNQNGELDLYDAATGQGAITAEWLKDRALFLTWKNQKNLDDIADGIAIRRKDNGAESYLYTDKTLKDARGHDYSIQVTGGNTVQQIDPIRISFASDQGDTLQGGSYADHLYGGRGKDRLEGGGGADYLEGGAEDDALAGGDGDDKLIGGNGADTLTGGAGDDVLQGGKGDDVLQGGADSDLYVIRTGDGRDTILDHEGRNTIIYEDASGKRTPLAIPAFAVAGQANTWRGQLADGGDVTITRNSPLTATLPDGTQFIVEDFQDGDLGIYLEDGQDSPAAAREIYGDLLPVFSSDPENPYFYDDLGNVVVDAGIQVQGNSDRLWGSEGNDFISTGMGADVVLAMGGADRIQGDGTEDYLDGGDGDDVIEGRLSVWDGELWAYSRLVGGNGNDRLYAEEEVDLSEDIIAGGITYEQDQTPGPILSGGQGDDVLVGSDYRDGLYGGLGKDILVGRGGNDFILGDYTYEPSESVPRDQPAQMPAYSALRYSVAEFDMAEGDNDIVFGGTGDDEIWGEGGDDWISGGEGYDFIVGGRGSDVLLGGAGGDSLYADGRFGDSSPADRDVLDGGDGNDFLKSNAGDDLFLGGAGDDYISCGPGDNLAFGGEGKDTIRVTGSGRNEIYGEAGNDSLMGGGGEDYLDGGEGDDLLLASGGADIMLGGQGNDTFEPAQDDILQGGEGDDVYKFRLGAGRNTISDDVGSNQIVLDSREFPDWPPDWPQDRILRTSIRLVREGDGYRIHYGDRGDEILLGAAEFASLQGLTLRHVTGYGYAYDPEQGEDARVELFSDEFVEFSQLDLQQLGSDDDDVLLADAAFDSTLDGGTGDDFIVGGAGADTLIGGAGNDALDGGDGGDRYVYNPGDGVDLISDSGTQGVDTLAFGAGIAPDAITLGTGSLLIRIGNSGDAVHLDGFDTDDAGSAGAIERFEFADGAVLTHAQLISRGFDLYGTDGDDTVFGTSVVDRFYQSAGDDIMIGGAGDDSYYFGPGSGRDLIVDQDAMPGNVDTIVLGSGIAAADLVVTRSTGMLTLAVAGGSDRLDLQWQPQDGLAIERIQFADGSIWESDMLETQAAPASPADPPSESQAGSGSNQSGGDNPATADAGTIDAEMGMPAGDEVAQTGSSATSPEDAASPDAVVVAPVIDDTIPIANNDALPADIDPTDTGTPAIDAVVQTENSVAPPAEAASPVIDDTIAIANSDAQPVDAVPPAVNADAVSDDSKESTAIGDASTGEAMQSAADYSIAAANGGVAPTQEPRTTATPSQREIPSAALQTLDAGDSADALVQPRNSVKAVDAFNAQVPSAPFVATQSPASFFSALQPTKPDMQSWLDNWLGPGARASAGAGDQSSADSYGEGPQPLTEPDRPAPAMQDFEPHSPTGDPPEAPPAAALTPEEIAQRYADSAAWLAANSGSEPELAWESGAPPQQNPFGLTQSGSAADNAVSMAWFGQSPGMAAIGGHALQPLRGISEGCAALGFL